MARTQPSAALAWMLVLRVTALRRGTKRCIHNGIGLAKNCLFSAMKFYGITSPCSRFAKRSRLMGGVGRRRKPSLISKGHEVSMREVIQKKSIEFFETQFQRQVQDQEYALNPFETLALDYLKGSVLDLGSGLGNLSLEAARRGHSVVSVDASPTAVARINTDAHRDGLPVQAIQADIGRWIIDRSYDTIVAIGLLMFFRREPALKLLRAIQQHVSPGERAIVNVLIEGTTYMGMFDPGNYYLFRRSELEEQFSGWVILSSRYQTFAAPGQTRKEFSTVIAEKAKQES